MARISIDNGATWTTAEHALQTVSLDQLVLYMDDDTREAVHADPAPCTDLEFLTAYLDHSLNDLIIG